MGKIPQGHPKAPFTPGSVSSLDPSLVGVSHSSIVDQGMKHLMQHPYVYGGGHGGFNCRNGAPLDCSSFVSCVLHELGLLNTVMASGGFLVWKGGTLIPWDQRLPGDLVVWTTHHIGIVQTDTHYISHGHGQGPHIDSYGRFHNGTPGQIVRVKNPGAAKPLTQVSNKSLLNKYKGKTI